MKTTILIAAILVAVLGITMTVRFAKDAQSHEQNLNQERYNRMVAEESLASANTKINALETELERLQNKIKNSEKLLSETNAMNDDLKARLDKAMQIKGDMEKKIGELQNIVAPAPAPAGN